MNDIQTLIQEQTKKMKSPVVSNDSPLLEIDDSKIGGLKYSGQGSLTAN